MTKDIRAVLITLSKRNAPSDIVSLIMDGVIDLGDIEDFSDDLKETVHFLIERQKISRIMPL